MQTPRRTRVIINTDAKNEADDQFAIVQGLLTPSFELHGLIPAHFGSIKSATSLQDSHDEVMLLLRLMGLEGKVRGSSMVRRPPGQHWTRPDSIVLDPAKPAARAGEPVLGPAAGWTRGTRARRSTAASAIC